VFGVVVAGGSPAAAQDLVYTPISPTFGGNSFNSAHLLGIANAQNDYKDPSAASSSSQQCSASAPLAQIWGCG